MSWTDDRINLLKKMWVEGKTAAEIAKELGDVTRNAVIGKAHRLKLSNRVSPIQQNKKPAVKQAPRAASEVVPAEKRTKIILEKDKNRKTVSLLDLNARMCRWPIGDPRDENFGFCGDRSVEGFPYCEDHAKAAYQAAGRSRKLNAEDFEDKPSKNPQSEDDDAIKVSVSA
jgi:GcrA cell cycle regulator